MTARWFFQPEQRRDPQVRLVCLPYAGASAAAFRLWGQWLPDSIEVLGVQLPGRGWRMRESPVRELVALADRVAEAVLPLDDLPMVLFGHSFGSWLGLEVARRMRDAGRPPACLIVSGRQAPASGSSLPTLSHLSEAEFVEEIQLRYQGIPPEIASNPDVLELVLPALRSDIAALEEYEYTVAEPLPCDLVAFGGGADTIVPSVTLEKWAAETSASFRTRTFPGGHFYLQDRECGLFEEIQREAERLRVEERASG